MIILGIITLISYAVLYGIINAPVPGFLKALLGIGEMVIVGIFISKRLNITGEWGLMLLRSQKGLEIINLLAKRFSGLATYLADCNVVLSYGLLSFFLMRKHVRLSTIIGGFVALAVIIYVIAPFVAPVLQSVLGFDSQAVPQGQSEATKIPYLFYVYLALLLCGGLFLILLLGMWIYGAMVISALISTFIYGTKAIQNTQPGGTFLLPGINLPLFEGIAALAIILVVHESAHAILARIGKIPVKSSGLVLFGVIPIGAFVEPDEVELKKAPSVPQSRVIIAGTAANFLTCIVLFGLWFVVFSTTQGFRDTGLLVTPAQGSTLEAGTVIYGVNGLQTTNLSDLAQVKNTIGANESIILSTDAGNRELVTDKDGRIGVLLVPVGKNTVVAKFKVPFLGSVYTLLGLAFVLNFIIGSINLLPLPFFDGYRMLEINLRHKRVLSAIMYLTLVSFIMNFVPWLFR